jgi:hypothetical protein
MDDSSSIPAAVLAAIVGLSYSLFLAMFFIHLI